MDYYEFQYLIKDLTEYIQKKNESENNQAQQGNETLQGMKIPQMKIPQMKIPKI